MRSAERAREREGRERRSLRASSKSHDAGGTSTSGALGACVRVGGALGARLVVGRGEGAATSARSSSAMSPRQSAAMPTKRARLAQLGSTSASEYQTAPCSPSSSHSRVQLPVAASSASTASEPMSAPRML